jgi:hypothetical protein
MHTHHLLIKFVCEICDANSLYSKVDYLRAIISYGSCQVSKLGRHFNATGKLNRNVKTAVDGGRSMNFAI